MTYDQLASKFPMTNMHIVSMVDCGGGKIIVATAFNLFLLKEGKFSPLEFEYLDKQKGAV